MQYLGGKSRIAPKIAEYLTALRKPGQLYVEPFVGGAWVLERMADPRCASDAHLDLILLYKALQDGWDPPTTLSREQHHALRHAEPSALRAFAGFGCSFAGKWFGGHIGEDNTANHCSPAGSRRSLLKQLPKIVGTQFTHQDYAAWELSDALIYCDPPYAGTSAYSGCPKFDHERFWETMKKWSISNTVVISEYKAPEDFACVLEIPTMTEVRTVTGRDPRMERLFRWKGV